MLKKIFLVVLLGIFFSDASYAVVQVSGVLVPNFSSVSGGTPIGNYSYDSKLSIGFGALVEVPVAAEVGAELGILYYTRKYESYNSSTLVDSTFYQPILLFPMILRWHFLPNISLGGGLYYGHYMGSYSREDQNTATPTNSITYNYSYGDLNVPSKSYDIGAALVLGTNFFLGSLQYMIDLRYYLALTNDDARPNTTTKFHDLQFLLGVKTYL